MKKYKKPIIIILICLVIAIILPLTWSLAKYVKDVVLEYQMKSKGFYFSSPDLEPNKVINSWSGEAINFTLLNSISDELITEYDINYEVTCEILGDASSLAACHVNNEETNSDTGVLMSYQHCLNNKQDGIDVANYNKDECELGGYTWEKQIATQNLSFKIIPNEEEEINEIEVKISINSTSPYKKTLVGNFILYKAYDNSDKLQTEYHDLGDFIKLVLTNKQSNQRCINIKWDSEELLIDEDISFYNSYEVDENDNIEEIEFNEVPNSSREFTFFKKTENEITLENFEISDCTP
ncbi:MAG: hypothetical protein GX265_02185 [Mollicutes bacterium]|nr:hypothetical protein [Mollicutes bacterium]